MYEYIGLPAKINQLVQSANKLGDPQLELELDDTDLEEAAHELLEFHLNTLTILAKARKQIYSISLQLITVYELSYAGAGYAGGKIMDTNENASDFKTWATLFGSAMAGSLINGVLTSVVVNQQIKDLESDEPLHKQIESALGGLASAKKRLNMSHSEFSPAAKKHIDDVSDLLIKIASTLATVRTFSGIASAYHGFKRNNDNLGYAMAWGLTGLFTATPIGLALEQGFAKPLN